MKSIDARPSASDMIADTRKKLAALVGIHSENNVIFSPSATIAMNQVLFGLTYSPETVVYISPFEHNAVVRPLYRLQKQYGFRIELLPFDTATQELNRQAMQNMFANQEIDHLREVNSSLRDALNNANQTQVLTDTINAQTNTILNSFGKWRSYPPCYDSCGCSGLM